MTRIISIVAGKGGVGKTFLTSNLAIALTELGKDVIAIDSNLTTPNLGIHLGIPLYPVTLQDVIKTKADPTPRKMWKSKHRRKRISLRNQKNRISK